MKIIKPSEISARILTLLDESDERVILISPYMKISKWYKFSNKLVGVRNRGIPTEIYVRDDPDNQATYHDLDQLRLPYKKIPHLHSKLYLNERHGIVTSMNLLLSSEISSLELGYETETWEEYSDLLAYYRRYIHLGEPFQYNPEAGRHTSDLYVLIQNFREEFNRAAKDPWLWFEKDALHISSGRNRYIVSIENAYLRIGASLGIQPSKTIAMKIEDITTMMVKIHPGPATDALRLTVQSQFTLKSRNITGILESELARIIDSVVKFIDVVEGI